MAKRSDSTLNYKPILEPKKLDIDPHPTVIYNYVTNLLPSRVIREINGNRYEWQPGQTVKVLATDTDALRDLKLGERACCGGAEANRIFEVSEV